MVKCEDLAQKEKLSISYYYKRIRVPGDSRNYGMKKREITLSYSIPITLFRAVPDEVDKALKENYGLLWGPDRALIVFGYTGNKLCNDIFLLLLVESGEVLKKK
jgi:hypothetical protein